MLCIGVHLIFVDFMSTNNFRQPTKVNKSWYLNLFKSDITRTRKVVSFKEDAHKKNVFFSDLTNKGIGRGKFTGKLHNENIILTPAPWTTAIRKRRFFILKFCLCIFLLDHNNICQKKSDFLSPKNLEF